MYKIRFRKCIVAIAFDKETTEAICLLGTHFASFEVGRVTDKIRADVDNVYLSIRKLENLVSIFNLSNTMTM